MTGSFASEARKISSELERSLRGAPGRGPQYPCRPYHRRAAEKAARISGRRPDRLRERIPDVRPAPVDPLIVEHITTEVMKAWLRTGPRAADARQRLLRPLTGVAHARGRCEGKPLGLWMLEKARSADAPERKAIAEAVRLMLAAPPIQGELATILGAQLSDPNRMVRAAAASIAARAGKRIANPAIEEALLGCLRDCIENALRSTRPPLRPARDIGELEVYAEDLRGNHPDAYAWTAAAAAFAGIGLPTPPGPALAELEKGLVSPHWLMRVVAATLLARAGRTHQLAETAAAQIRSADPAVRQAALRQLFALAEVTRLPAQALRALREAAHTGDLCTRAASIWPLAATCRREGPEAATLREDIRALAVGAAWPLHSIAEEALLYARSFGAGDLLERFQRYAAGTTETSRRLGLFETAESAPAADRASAGCIHILYDWHDLSTLGQEALLERMDSVERVSRQADALRQDPGRVDFSRSQRALSILLFGDIRAAIAAVDQISRALFPIHPVRVALHCGTDLAVRPQPSGDYAVEGKLVAAAGEIAAKAAPREVLVSDRVAETLYSDRDLTRRLQGKGMVNVAGAVELRVYHLDDPVRALASSGYAVAPARIPWTENAARLVKKTFKLAFAVALLFGLVYGGVRWGPDLKARLDTLIASQRHAGPARTELARPVPPATEMAPGGEGATSPREGTSNGTPSDIKISEEKAGKGGGAGASPRPAAAGRKPTISVSSQGKALASHKVMPEPAGDGGENQAVKVGVTVAIGIEGINVTKITAWDVESSFALNTTDKYQSFDVVGKWICVRIEYVDPVTNAPAKPVTLGFTLPPPPKE